MSGGTVLLVEDSRDVRNVVAEIVSLLGYDVTLASDGVEAWKKLSEGRYDLVITDMGLPQMGGEDLIRKMRIEDINLPVILIAGVDAKTGKRKLEELPNCSFIQKPFKIEELKSIITESLKGGSRSRKSRKRAGK